jgi:hypothetical protein
MIRLLPMMIHPGLAAADLLRIAARAKLMGSAVVVHADVNLYA